jgi:riboflavin biosynthesis pyrimidine reductase
VDKVLAFISPIIIGGHEATSVGGNGVDNMAKALRLNRVAIKSFGADVLVSGYVENQLPQGV